MYNSTSTDYPVTPDISSGTYVLNSNGSMTMTESGITSPMTGFYKVVGSYLIIGSETSVDANAYIKQ